MLENTINNIKAAVPSLAQLILLWVKRIFLSHRFLKYLLTIIPAAANERTVAKIPTFRPSYMSLNIGIQMTNKTT
jgi:hypothetical protein